MTTPETALLAALGGLVVMLSGVIGAGLRALWKGDLVTRPQHEDVIQERNTWRAFGMETLRQNGKLVSGVSTVLDKAPAGEGP